MALGDGTYFQLFVDSQSLSAPVAPVGAPYSTSTPTAPVAPVAAMINVVNSLTYMNVTLTIWDSGVPRQSAGMFVGLSEYVYTSGTLYVEVTADGVLLHTNYINVTLGKIYSYFVCSHSNGFLLENRPNIYSLARSYVRVLNCRKSKLPMIISHNIYF